MTPLADHLARRIAQTGPITLADYMGDCLSHPEFGYYPTRDPIGANGDFITSPEISQMYGELIGLWLAEVWRLNGGPKETRLIEIGPGRGVLMRDILRAARMMPGFPDALSVHLVETSPVLRDKQRETLSDICPNIQWHERLSDIPEDGFTLVVTNELFDALPIRQFEMTATGWRERLVTFDDASSRFGFTLAAGPGPAEALIPKPAREGAKRGEVAEIAPAAWGIARNIAERVARLGGAALIVDYGYDGPARGDTFQAVKAHEYVDPFEAPGEADLTAHVDFGSLAHAAAGGGASVAPLSTQREFLQALGIEMRAASLMHKKSEAKKNEIAAERDRLIGTDQMGTLFKVLALHQNGAPALPGLER